MRTIIYIHYASAFSVALPFIAGLWATFRLKKNSLFMFSAYQSFMFFAQFMMVYVMMFGVQSKNNLFVVHLFMPFQFLLLTYILIEWMGKRKLWLVFAVPVCIVAYIQYTGNFHQWSLTASIIESISLTILSIITIYSLIRNGIKEFDKLIIVVGVIAYFGANSIIGLLYDKPNLLAPQTIVAVVNLIANITYSIGLGNNVK